jgi:hypothetical protein
LAPNTQHPTPITRTERSDVLDYVPGRMPSPIAPPPDTSLPRQVFSWLAARLAARRREDLPIGEPGLRADLALGFAVAAGDDVVWPEVAYPGGARLGLLVRRAMPEPPIAVEARYARRIDGQATPSARQLGELLRDTLRLYRAWGESGLPVQVLLSTDEFRTYLAGQRPPLRLLRPDVAGTELAVDIAPDTLDDAARHRLSEVLSGPDVRSLRLSFDVLGYAPVGALHLAMWRVAAVQES